MKLCGVLLCVLLLGSYSVTSVSGELPLVIGYVNTYGVTFGASTQYNVLILSFLYLGNGYTVKLGGAIQGWQTPTTVSELNLADYLAASPSNMVFLSIGGADWASNDWQSLIGNEATFAQNVANLANNITSPDSSGKLHPIRIAGIDIDYEDNGGIYPPNSVYDGVTLLINLSKELKSRGFLVSHAPQGPYLCTPAEDNNSSYSECSPGIGGYLDVMQQGGQYIDFLNIQYYNNPSFNSVDQLMNSFLGLQKGFTYNGKFLQIPTSKMVIGKPNQPGDAGSGYIPVNQLVSQVLCPLSNANPGSFAGAMTWKYHDGSWGATVRSALNGGC